MQDNRDALKRNGKLAIPVLVVFGSISTTGLRAEAIFFFLAITTGDGLTGLSQIRNSPPDLLILDLMIPKISGLNVCKEVRRDVGLNRLPILILTAKGEEDDRVLGLELGADDYVAKPFRPRERVARVKTILRLADAASQLDKPIEIGDLRIDPAACRLT